MDATRDPGGQPVVLCEQERALRRWRYRQLRRLGLTILEARLLTEAGIDLGPIRALVAGGCPPRLAFRIAF